MSEIPTDESIEALDTDVQTIVVEAIDRLSTAANDTVLADTKAVYLGKSGSLTGLMKQLGKLDPAERSRRGQVLNKAKRAVELAIEKRTTHLRDQELERRLSAQTIDVTLPGRTRGAGGLHPISIAMERIEAIFRSIGFDVADGPEIETDEYNFAALNMPQDHPARSMHDTFYVEHPQDGFDEKAPLVLRTHTSPMQIRYARTHEPPIKVIAPGKTYRVDSDATHSPMFHQFEGMWIDEDVSFADLKSVYIDFLHRFFERDDIDVRFRPSYFPFTEPSAEIDMRFAEGPLKGRWLEVSGSGQVHPNVVRNIGLDPERYTGFAFGSGIERLAMLRYGVDDLRLFFENDLRFLGQFR